MRVKRSRIAIIIIDDLFHFGLQQIVHKIQSIKWLINAKIMKYLFYKEEWEKNGTFHMKIVLKGGNKHARIICDTCSKLSIRAQKWSRIFSLWTTFNNFCGVLTADF